MHLEPIVSFAILLAVILIVPPIVERFKLPGLLGLLIAGVVLGSHGFKLLQTESETMKLLSDIGLVYLMFVAGLEVDIDQFHANKHRSAGFGFFTFIVPLIFGTTVGQVFGFGWNASILIGSLFASHTLLAYPIISRLGVVNNEAVIVTIGATIFTDIGALLVLAVCIGIHGGDFTIASLAALLLGLALYSALILFGFNWLGKAFFRRSGDEEGNQFLFILLVVFVSSLGAELIGVEKIVGAFLAGLAVNSVVGDSPVKEKIVFVGEVLFIPIFFVDLGLLIDIPGFISSLTSIWLTLAIVVGLIASKFVAALLAKWAYHYSWTETLVMWSLSLPQVAATLAATLVGFRAGLLSEAVLNGVIVLMLVTATLGPMITARTATRLVIPDLHLHEEADGIEERAIARHPFTIMVPVYNPRTEQYLIEFAALLVRHTGGKIVSLSITPSQLRMDAPELESALNRSQNLLERAVQMGEEFDVAVQTVSRIDDGIAQGISRASREHNADLIMLGWGRTTGLRARLFGNVIDTVLWAAHCPVAMARFLDSPMSMQNILLPIDNLSNPTLRIIELAEAFSTQTQAKVTLLHVYDRAYSPARIQWMQSQLTLLSSRRFAPDRFEVQVIASQDIVGTIVNSAQASDLVILRSMRQRHNVGELTLSNVTTEVAQRVACSVVVVGEPQRYNAPLLLREKAQTTVTRSIV